MPTMHYQTGNIRSTAITDRKTVVIFPANPSIHDLNASPFSQKQSPTDSIPVRLLGEVGVPTIGLPITKKPGMTDQEFEALRNNAFADLYRAVGAGFDLMLPVRNTGSNGMFFEAPLNEKMGGGGIEPNFWSRGEPPDHYLGNYYVKELDKLERFTNQTTPEVNNEDPFHKAYLEGKELAQKLTGGDKLPDKLSPEQKTIIAQNWHPDAVLENTADATADAQALENTESEPDQASAQPQTDQASAQPQTDQASAQPQTDQAPQDIPPPQESAQESTAQNPAPAAAQRMIVPSPAAAFIPHPAPQQPAPQQPVPAPQAAPQSAAEAAPGITLKSMQPMPAQQAAPQQQKQAAPQPQQRQGQGQGQPAAKQQTQQQKIQAPATSLKTITSALEALKQNPAHKDMEITPQKDNKDAVTVKFSENSIPITVSAPPNQPATLTQGHPINPTEMATVAATAAPGAKFEIGYKPLTPPGEAIDAVKKMIAQLKEKGVAFQLSKELQAIPELAKIAQEAQKGQEAQQKGPQSQQNKGAGEDLPDIPGTKRVGDMERIDIDKLTGSERPLNVPEEAWAAQTNESRGPRI